jgi:hypothetical protein
MPSDLFDHTLAGVHELRRERQEIVRALATDRARGAEVLPQDANLRGLADREQRLSEALCLDTESGSALRAQLGDWCDNRARVLRVVALIARADARAADARRRAKSMRARAARSDRALTAPERAEIDDLAHKAIPDDNEWAPLIRTSEMRRAVLENAARDRLRRARSQLNNGLLLTPQMVTIIDEALPALHRGEPLLFIGETGGAKTALAEYLSRHHLGQEPELVSGYGDVNSYQLFGAHELRSEAGITVSAFVPGPVVRAMSEGIPLILDELNAMPADFLKRFNKILQLRPGDPVAVQEDSGHELTVAQGFCVIATANEQSKRYRGLEPLSAEFLNRFGPNTFRVRYPDAGRGYADQPVENLLLAAASVADKEGSLPHGLSATDLERIARAAFLSQQVFSGQHGEGFDSFLTSERRIDGRPGLEEHVLAPRTLVDLLRKVTGSNGAISLQAALDRFLDGVGNEDDRRVLSMICTGAGLGTGRNERELA